MGEKQIRLQNIYIYIIDCICVGTSYVLASFMRFGFGNLVGGYSKQIVIMRMGILFMALTLFYLVFNPNVDFFRRGKKQELAVVLYSNAVMGAIMISVAFFMKDAEHYSRLIYAYFCCIDIVLMYVAHYIYKKYMNEVYSKLISARYMIVLTVEERAEKICQNIQKNNAWNVSVNGLILEKEKLVGADIAGIPVVADYKSMMEYIKKNAVDEVFIHLPSQTELPIKKIIKELETMGIVVNLNINTFELEVSSEKQIEKIGTYYTVSFAPKIHSFKQLFIKRVMDIVGAIIGLMLTAIITIFLAPILLLESPGPLFFSQTRVGKNGRRFQIYKFRSMYIDAEERKKELMDKNEMDGLMFKMENDPRVTKVGKFIRKTSLDEFPQFWNVLKGEMSLVGTRPPTEEEFLQYEGYHKRRLSATPGLTGVWQVSGRSDTKNFEDIVKMDVDYINNWSLKKDVLILFKTVDVVLRGRGAK